MNCDGGIGPIPCVKMNGLDEDTELEELGEGMKAERDAFEAARRAVKDWDHRSAVHYYRLGHALTWAKAKLGRAAGRPGRFRAWHVNHGIDQNTASRAMRLYEAAYEDGGEEAQADLGWWASLKHYEIISDDNESSKPGERPNYGDSPDRRESAGDAEVESEGEEPTLPPKKALPIFDDIASFGGFRRFLARQLVALRASESRADSILKREYEAIQAALMEALQDKLPQLLRDEPVTEVFASDLY